MAFSTYNSSDYCFKNCLEIGEKLSCLLSSQKLLHITACSIALVFLKQNKLFKLAGSDLGFDIVDNFIVSFWFSVLISAFLFRVLN